MFKSHLFKRFKIKQKKYTDIEPQEVFLDQLAQKKEEELGISEKKFEIPLSQRSIKGLFIIFIILFSIFFAKALQYQVLEHKKFLALADQNKFAFRSLKAERGIIYDYNGEQLVFNQVIFNLVIDKKKLPNNDLERLKVINEVAKIMQLNPNELEEKIRNNQENEQKIVIKKNINHEKVVVFETKINSLPGVELEKKYTRYYKDGPSFSHLIGYIGKISTEELKTFPNYSINDFIGREGIEKSYEEVLKENKGITKVERDVYGNILSEEISSLPQSGKNLVLWLNADLQRKIEEELKKIMKKTNAKKAVGVALNPKTGGIMALVSLPSYDNNLLTSESNQESLENLFTNPEKPFFNRVIAGLYPTGSVIKPLIAIAALEEKIILPQKKIFCQGEITVPNKYNPEIIYHYRDWRTHGFTDIRKAIAESCDVYFYTIGGGYGDQKGLGPSNIKKYLELFGWGNETGIDLPGEKKGFIPSPDWKKKAKNQPWFDGDTYNISIGQGDLQITPIQVTAAFGAIANNGTLFKPTIVKSIIDSEKNIINEIKPVIVKQNFINPENLQIVKDGMRMAVTGENSPFASSVILNSLPVAVAAKTGTAETSLKNHYHNWITVFGPYENPEIVLTIMVENVEKVQAVALPVAKEILNWYFNK